jgi:glycerol-3-phosphate O-acyltransferase
MGFGGLLMSAARRLLFAWVRTRTFPESRAALGLAAARPVCYVVEQGWLTDWLVTQETAARLRLPPVGARFRLGSRRFAGADFSLVQPWRPWRDARERMGVPRRLLRLVAAVQADAAADVQIVPVSVLWGRAPRQQDGILRALFAESWRRRNPFGHVLAVLLHGRQSHVQFGAPFSLRELIDGMPDAALAARKCARMLRVHFRRRRAAAIGPDVSHRHTQVTALLAAPEVQAAVAAEAARERIGHATALMRARQHVLAIASDYSYTVVRAGELFLAWVWTRLFDGVEVRGFDALTHIAPGQSLVYVPCHRSHLDYLLLSYVIFRGGLTPPHIAAGDNLDLPLLGGLLRRGGAFFLRRSFKGDPLYAAVFSAYLHHLLARGFPIEFFIEGGRSRNGLLLAPKAGLLGMTVHSFVKRHERPLVFVPVYVGYEKLPEGASFVRELAGQPKRRESLLGLLSAVRVLRRNFGRVHVNFGTPLPLADWLDARQPDWRAPQAAAQEEADWLRPAVGAIADELARRINAAARLNPVNAVALALLAVPGARMEADVLARRIELLQSLADAERTPGADCIAAALRLDAVAASRDSIAADANQAAQLAYFRNNALHLLALPALAAHLVLTHAPLAEARLPDMAAGLFGLLRDSLYMAQTEETLPQALGQAVAQLAENGLLEREAGRLQAPREAAARADLEWLAEILRPLLAAAAQRAG